MNHITQIFKCKLTKADLSPSFHDFKSSRESTDKADTRRRSWASKMLSKVKVCSSAIKGIVAYERTPDSRSVKSSTIRNQISIACKNLSPFLRNEKGRISHEPSVPDIITSTNYKTTEMLSMNERGQSHSPSLNLDSDSVYFSSESMSVSFGNRRPNHESSKYFSLRNYETLRSISDGAGKRKEYLETHELRDCIRPNAGNNNDRHVHGKRKTKSLNESKDRVETVPVKRKISAEPFLTYTQGSLELFWENDSGESFSVEEKNVSDKDESLASFLANEKRLQEESFQMASLRSEEVSAVKTKISAEPFVSYIQESVMPVWMEDLNDSFSPGKTSSLDHPDSPVELLGAPCSSSTFCDDDTECDRQSPIPKASGGLEDSGIENNIFLLRENL